MHQINSLEKIGREVKKLAINEQWKLLENIIHQLGKTMVVIEKSLDWNKLYGIGKDLWKNDAQEYVNSLREDRI